MFIGQKRKVKTGDHNFAAGSTITIIGFGFEYMILCSGVSYRGHKIEQWLIKKEIGREAEDE